jgi:hypothetical protein
MTGNVKPYGILVKAEASIFFLTKPHDGPDP